MKFVATIFLVCASLQIALALDLQEAVEIIKSSFPNSGLGVGKPLCQTYSCCNLTETETCSLSSMPKDKTMLVLPGGETRCIYSDSTPYAFQVVPGDSDKLVFYFQGGGACWDKFSTTTGLCTSDSSPSSANGIFKRDEPRNALKSHTIVNALYCSGDIFVGDVVRDYNDKKGVPVAQKGLANVEATLRWVEAQQAAGILSSTLSSVVVMGASAGAIGAEVWGNEILKRLSWKQAAIIPDSYAGVFPEGTQGPLIESFGMCKAKFLPPSLLADCVGKTLSLQQAEDYFMSELPTVPYVFIQSKVDSVQQAFYAAVGATTTGANATITPSLFYDDVNEVFGNYNKVHPNFLTYLVDGDQHTFTGSSSYYTADAKGGSDNGKTAEKALMHEFVNAFPLAPKQVAESVCEGSLLASARATADTTFCSSSVVPKSYVQA